MVQGSSPADSPRSQVLMFPKYRKTGADSRDQPYCPRPKTKISATASTPARGDGQSDYSSGKIVCCLGKLPLPPTSYAWIWNRRC